MTKSKSKATLIPENPTGIAPDDIELARQAGYDAGYEDARSLGNAELSKRIDELERRHNLVSRTVNLLTTAALEDAMEGATPEQMRLAMDAGVQAGIEAAAELRALVTR